MRQQWTVKSLECCIDDVTYTTKIQRKDFLNKGRYPVVSQEEAFINGYWNEECDVFRVRTPLVVFGDHTKALKYVDFDFVLGADGVKLLQPVKELEPKFFYYQLQSVVGQIESLGYARHYRLVRGLEIAYPRIEEQRRIVAILDNAFESIAIARANAEKNLQNARELFECQLEEVFSGSQPLWGSASLASLCDVKHGFAFDGKEFSARVPVGKPLVITPGNFTEDGNLSFTDQNTKRFSGKIPQEFVFARGDLVLVMTDLSSKMKILGKPAFVEEANVLHNQRIGKCIFLNDKVEPRLVYYFMLSEPFLKGIRASATGTMVKHTAPRRILAAVIPFPKAREEQLKVVQRFDRLRDETRCLESIYRRKLAALDELKQSLLHQAFSGQL